MESRSSQQNPRRGMNWPVIGIIGLLFLVVVIPIARYSFENETSKWRVAFAQKKYAAGEKTEAIELMKKVVEEMPDNEDAVITLATWLAANDQKREAMKLSEDLYLANPRNRKLADAHIRILQACDRHRKASELYDRIHKNDRPKTAAARISQLNSTAYMRALGSRKLDEAAEKIDLAIGQWEDQISKLANLQMYIADAVLLATLELASETDFDHLQMFSPELMGSSGSSAGESLSFGEKKRMLLDRRISDKLPELERAHRKFRFVTAMAITEKLPLTGESRGKFVDARKELHRQQESMAVLLAYRAYVLQELGKDGDAERDRAYVLGLGYEPQDLIDRLPNQELCLFFLLEGPMYLDTRGFVAFRRKEYESAVDDLDLAIAGTEILLETDEVANSFSLVAMRIKQTLKDIRKNRLVLLDHRRRANEKISSAKAKWDRQRLKELGATPGKNLF